MLPPDHRAGPRSVRTPTAAARGGAQRPADTRCCRRAAPDSVTAAPASWRYSTAAARIWAPVHAGHSRPSGKRATPARRPQATAATAASGEPYRPPQRQEPHRRLDQWQRAIRTDVDVAVVNCIDNFPNPLSAMPDALYTEARTTRARRRRSPVGDQAAVAFRADCLIRGSGRPISLRLLSHGTRFPLQSPGVSGIGQGTAVLRQPNTAGRVVILVRCACGNGTVAPSQARTLHLSASGPGGLLESRPELHTGGCPASS